MLLLLAALFIGLPILEIFLLIQAGGHLGTLPVIALCVVTGVVGAWLARSQGEHTLRRAEGRLRRGEVPASEALDGVMIALAGVLLMTPGFVTDGLGLLLLLPPSRALLKRLASGWIERQTRLHVQRGQGFHAHFGGGTAPPWSGPRAPERSERPDAQAQPEVEFLPPERAPRPPSPKRPPRIIDVD